MDSEIVLGSMDHTSQSEEELLKSGLRKQEVMVRVGSLRQILNAKS